MALYRIFFKKSVEKDLRSVPKSDVQKIIEKIRSLGENPRLKGSEKLTGQDRYRVRQGRYRIVYSVQDDELTIWVIKVGHRKDIYR